MPGPTNPEQSGTTLLKKESQLKGLEDDEIIQEHHLAVERIGTLEDKLKAPRDKIRDLLDLYQNTLGRYNDLIVEEFEEGLTRDEHIEKGEIWIGLGPTEKQTWQELEQLRQNTSDSKVNLYRWENYLKALKAQAVIRDINLPTEAPKKPAKEAKRYLQEQVLTEGSENVFFKKGNVYTIQYEGEGPVQLSQGIGLHYIACLIRHQGQRFKTPVQLQNLVQGTGDYEKIYSSMTEEQLSEKGLSTSGGKLGPHSDNQALQEYGQRLKQVIQELDQAKKNHNLAPLDSLQEEKEWLLKEIKKATSQPKKWDDADEKARKKIGKAITSAIGEIKEHLPNLGQHLQDNIKPYSFSQSYDPSQPVNWIP